MRKKRLLLIDDEFPPLGGGAGTATYNIAGERAAPAVDVTVTISAFQGLPRHKRMQGYEVVRIPTLRRRKDRCSILERIIFILSAALYCLPIARRHRTVACTRKRARRLYFAGRMIFIFRLNKM